MRFEITEAFLCYLLGTHQFSPRMRRAVSQLNLDLKFSFKGIPRICVFIAWSAYVVREITQHAEFAFRKYPDQCSTETSIVCGMHMSKDFMFNAAFETYKLICSYINMDERIYFWHRTYLI